MHKLAIVERFMNYVAFDTQAVEGTGNVPSNPGQMELARYLVDELHKIGLADASCDEHAYVIATLPSNCERHIPTVALIAHLDTAFEVSGRNVKARIIEYTGGDVILDPKENIRIAEADFPELVKFKGQELIVTDGHTLLGADDKAGIAAIVEAMDWYVKHPEIEHGTIKIVFTPDEEIAHMAAFLDIEKLGADFAYTIDAGDVGEFCWETFNGAKTKVSVRGLSVHPGKAKNKMKNANNILLDFLSRLPEKERPEHTEGREGFFHVIQMSGNVEAAQADIWIRDHDKEEFENRKKTIQKIVEEINEKYGSDSCSAETSDQYANMGQSLAEQMHIVEYVREAMHNVGIEPIELAIRGGTDGSALSARGLPTPNIFKGGMNNHGPLEYLPVESLEKCYQVVRELIHVIASKQV